MLYATNTGKRLYDKVIILRLAGQIVGFLQPINTPDIYNVYHTRISHWSYIAVGKCPIYIIAVIYKHPFNMY